jgi:hypothetical protein
MIARVGYFDGFDLRTRDWVLVALNGAEGFRGGYHLVDEATGDGMSISFWDDETSAAAGEQLVAAASPPGGDGGPGPSRVQLLQVVRAT